MRIGLIQDIINKQRKVQEVAEICKVTRKTIHKRKRRYIKEGETGLYPKKPGPKKGATRNRTPTEIEDLVISYAKLYRFDGPNELKYKLEEAAIYLDQSTIYRILKRRKVRYHQVYQKPKKKKKLYVLDRPGRELQVDVSFPFGYSSNLVIYTAIDDCSRWIWSRVCNRHTLESSISFIKYILQTTTIPIKAIRTDQGREFSQRFTEAIRSYSIVHNKNPPYHPEHNGKVERYHRTMKEKEVSYRPFGIDIDEANYRMQQWVKVYNYKRKHTGLGMNRRTPYQALLDHAKNVTLILQ